ncbi:MAG: AAA family ATPase [Candidatus Dormibacteraeota bacterium]|nr:AAA family ATPase [Candidatus Dormibacteraeota bacterium]
MDEVEVLGAGRAVALVDRVSEAASIREFLEQAFRDGGALVLIGDAGVGKSELLNHANRVAQGAGALIVRTRGIQYEVDISFAALNQVLLPLLGELPALPPGHRDALNVALGLGRGRVPNRLVIANALLALLKQASATRPLLLIADDLPWLDRASAAALSFAARRLSGMPVAFLGALRYDEETSFDRTGLPELEISPLNDTAARTLVDAAFPTLSAPVRTRILGDAQGNPLALLELPAALSHPQRTAEQHLPVALPLSRRLQTVFATRIAALPSTTRQTLLLMAFDGTGDPRVLASADDPGGGIEGLDAAERARLAFIDTGTRRPMFRHPLIRSAVVEMSTQAERRGAHATLAELFAAQPDRHAWHLAEATVTPDEGVADLLARAAYRFLKRGDSLGAIAALTRAAELSPRRDDRARRLAEAAYLGADVSGDLRRAAQLLADAHEADPEFRHTLQAAATAAIVLINGEGDVDTAHRLLAGAIESTTAPGDIALEEALHTLTLVSFFGSSGELWQPFHRALERFSGPVPTALWLSGRSFADPLGRGHEALSRLDDEIAALVAENDPTQIIRIAIAAVYVDRLSGCRSALWRVIHDGRAGGAVGSAMQALMLMGQDDLFTGQWTEAEALLNEGVALCEAGGYELFAWPGRYFLALLAALRGDFDRAEAIADAMVRWALPRRIRATLEYAAHVRTLAALGSGDFEEAFAQATTITDAGTIESHVPMVAWSMLDLVGAGVRSGHRAEAAAHVAAMRAANVAAVSPRLALHATTAAALVEDDDGTSFELFEQALRGADAARWPFDLARVHLLYGERLRRSRATVDSRRHLKAAEEAFTRLGASPWAARAGAELRATGQVRPRTRDVAIESLTPQELEIARLAASGLTNKQIGEKLFLSHRTVSGHLHRVFPKLGVATRAALRDALGSLSPDSRGEH